MAQVQTRDKDTFWYNNEPITDIHEALHLLCWEGSSNEPIHLTYTSESIGWEIVEPWYTEGDSGGDDGGNNYYQINQSLADELQKEGLVTPRRINYMSGYSLIEDQLVRTEAAKAKLKAFKKEVHEKAPGLLVQGTHIDLTGEPSPAGWGREHRTYGRMYFDYRAPDGKICRVYPETGEIVFPYPPP